MRRSAFSCPCASQRGRESKLMNGQTGRELTIGPLRRRQMTNSINRFENPSLLGLFRCKTQILEPLLRRPYSGPGRFCLVSPQKVATKDVDIVTNITALRCGTAVQLLFCALRKSRQFLSIGTRGKQKRHTKRA
ncbi:hypothetical protein VTO42DRAFT_5093 [Malbranchea cinnamomea]